MAVQHAFDLGLTDDPALVFLLLGEAQQILGAIFPAFAAVAAVHRAIGLDAGEKIIGMGRVDIEARHGNVMCTRSGSPGSGNFFQ